MRLTKVLSVLTALTVLTLGGVWAVGQSPSPPQNPAPAPVPVFEYVTFDYETTIDAPYCRIDTTSNELFCILIVEMAYSADGLRFITCEVYDENTSTWQDAKSYSTGEPIQTVSVAGTGKVQFKYFILKTNSWGKAILNGTFPEAWAVGRMVDGKNKLKSTDSGWIGVGN